MSVAIALATLFLVAWEEADAGDVMSEEKRLVDFAEADTAEWYVINDGVMGGLSESGIRRTDDGTGLFAGMLSLENNGGFASVRAAIGLHDLSSYAGIAIRIKGDGRTYQLRLRTDDRFDGVAYRAYFDTVDGEWLTVRIPFDDFLPTFRGRMLTDTEPLDRSRIQQVAFMLADKKPGSFLLEIDFVRAWK